MVRMTDEITASNTMSTKHDTVTVTVDRGRLVFLGMQGVPAHVDQAIRPDVENVFRSRGIVASHAGSLGIADYVAQSIGTAPEWKRSNFETPFGTVNRASVEITITISLQRIRDGISINERNRSWWCGNCRFPVFGNLSRSAVSKGQGMEAAQKAVRDALARLSQ